MHIPSEFISKKRKDCRHKILLVVAYLISLSHLAFSQVSLITTINPSYNVSLGQLKNQVTLTLTSGRTSVDDGFITVLIQGDNGVIIQSNLAILDQTVSIFAGQTIMLQGQNGDLDLVLFPNALNFTGISSEEAFDTGLPPGTYQVCFRYWQNVGQPVSGAPPQGCSMFTIQGVGNVNVVTQVVPPYGTDLYNYSNTTKIFLQSPGNSGSVSLFLHITGDNGVDLQTLPDYIPNDINLSNANPISPIDLASYFDFANLTSSGQPIEQIMTNGLPEGKYQICVRLKSPDGEFITPEEPRGCSNMFDIRYSDPPIPVNPICGDTLHMPMQNIVFSWTPAPGAPPFTDYTLKIVEMLDLEQNPNDAMLTATEPAFFENTITGALSFYYGPGQPILESGRTYAWQVIAEDKETNTHFKNNGKSEVCWFVYKKTELNLSSNLSTLALPKKKSGPGLVTNADPIPVSIVSGKLFYKFKELPKASDIQKNATATGVSTNKPLINSGNQNKKNVAGGQQNLVVSNTALGTKKITEIPYNTNNVSTDNASPLANVKVSLVLTYVLKGEINGEKYDGDVIQTKSLIGQGLKNMLEEHDEVLATTTTGADGSFSFFFMNSIEDLGLVNGQLDYSTGKEFGDKASGELYKVIRLKVENKYYCSPDINIKLQPWESVDLGALVSYVKSYNLKVLTRWTNSSFYESSGGRGKPISDISTSLMRKTAVPFIPSNEANYESKGKLQLPTASGKILVSGKTNDGSIIFTNLVQHNPDNLQDRYYLRCVKNENEGLYNIKNRERSYYPIYNKDKQNFPFNSTSQYTPSVPQGGLAIPVSFGEDITWNSQLQVRTYEFTMELYPDKPRIAGKVQAEEVKAKPLADIKVVLLSSYKNSSNSNKLLRVAKTNSQGRYEFNDLDLELGPFDTLGTNVIGPDRTLICKPVGFKAGTKHIGKMLWGAQITDANFFLEPDGYLAGYVVDEDGNAVPASVNVDDLAFQDTKTEFIYDTQPASASSGSNLTFSKNAVISSLFTQNKPSGNQTNTLTASAVKLPTGVREVFRIKAPSGNGKKLSIIPKDKGYFELDTIIAVPEAGSANQDNLLKFVVHKAKKRIRFMVAEKPATKLYLPGSLKGLPGVTVKLDLPGSPITEITDKDGYVSFVFENSATTFDFVITPPENLDLEEGHYTLTNVPDTKSLKTYLPALLKKAARLSGIVTFGNANEPLPEATVYVDKGDGTKIEAKTDADGKYLLKGIPMDAAERTVWASKPEATPNIISQSKTIKLNAQNQLDFNLKTDNDILIKDIYGFPVEIKTKEKQPDGTFLISGNLINLPSNANFSLQQKDLAIPFSKLKIKKSGQTDPSGIPIGIPETNSFNTDIKLLKLIVQNAFGVVQSPASGDVLQVISDNGQGQIKGTAGVQKSSFQFSQNYVTFSGDPMFLLTDQPGSTNTDITILQVGQPSPKKFGLLDNQGKQIQFKLLGFNAKADQGKSYLEGDNISLFTVLSTNKIPAMVPSQLDLKVGPLVLHQKKFDPLSGDKPIKFNLEKWEVTGDKWALMQTSNGIMIPAGTIQTGLINIPVQNMLITPNNFDASKFEINNLTFSGVVPLNILTQNTSFGFNSSSGSDHAGHWELRIIGEEGQPGVSITGLPGLATGQALKFQAFSLFSNGEQKINLGNQQQTLTFYDVLKVSPVSFAGGKNYFEMSANINLGIPRIDEASGIIKFSKPGADVKFEIYPFNVTFDAPGNVKFIADLQQGTQSLQPGNFKAIGTIKDKEGIFLKGALHKTATNAWVEVDPKGQKLPLGSGQTSLANIEGKMEVDKKVNDWTTFTFSGDMQGFKGIQGDLRKTFTVNGSITADNEKVDVKNIPTPFGGIDLTYDIQHARLTGHMNIDKQMGGISMKGAANVLVDATGWYFLSGGQITLPGLGGMSAGMLIGDYHTMPGDVAQTLMQFAYDKNVPPSFQTGISGFFLTGEKDLPFINVPDFGIDLGVLSAHLGVTAGLDGRLWMGFDGGGNEYGIGAMAFAHAWFKAASITCTKLSAEARAELGAKGIYTTSNGTFTVLGCGSFTVYGSAQQCFPTPCWDGICCNACVGGGISKGIKVDLLLNSQGDTDLSFGFGNCSGQESMTGNW